MILSERVVFLDGYSVLENGSGIGAKLGGGIGLD